MLRGMEKLNRTSKQQYIYIVLWVYTHLSLSYHVSHLFFYPVEKKISNPE